MALHPQAEQFLNDIASSPLSNEIEPEQLREAVAGTAISDVHDLASVEDVRAPGPYGDLPMRIYRPQKAGVLPVIVFYHGGGFVLCNVQKYDPLCRKLAALTGCAVVSVDYRLAPEYKFPVAAHEAVFAVKWVAQSCASLGFDPDRIIVAGDSAGGNLAAVAARQAIAEGIPGLIAQILICPMTDFAHTYESYSQFASGYFLTKDMLDYFTHHYLRDDADRMDPLASPMLGSFDGLPPALILTAEYDPVRDEGESYGRRLLESGVSVTSRRYLGMVHGFYSMTDLFDDGHAVYEDIRSMLNSLLQPAELSY
ncbi:MULTISPECIES: alpha/beta hydrolase [Paenibacillus]|uniref:alpha/beta hydrolase n=1 Tax=Paenibacillus TaxID=44249 RepID=UPI0022B8E9C1|nr:alpha/beta hydrolase [Paenibacillus caseinilyticus]MCZ8520998.1 alpha/beta hydrolase [Paenibacillus caseinilyticus]